MSDKKPHEQEIGLSVTKPPKIQKQQEPVQEGESLKDLVKGITDPEELIRFINSRPTEDFLPWEKIPLPSMGLFYDGRVPEGIVEVRPMGLVTDKILATSRLAQSGQSIDYIFKHCVRFSDSSFDPLDLLVGDRMFLLFYLRGITHGNNYEFSITCTNEACKRQSNHVFDLNKLAGTIKSPKYNREPIKILLPHLTKELNRDLWVEMRLMRGRDLQIMMRNQKIKGTLIAGQAKSMAEVESEEKGPVADNEIILDSTIEDHLNMLIVSVNGVTDRALINGFVRKMHAADTATIRETLRDAQPGVDTRIAIMCPECKTDLQLDLPITESFFRPTESRGARE